MENIQLDPLSPFYAKREARQATTQNPAMGDLFANLLDSELKTSSDLKLGSDQETAPAKADQPNMRRTAYTPSRRVHQVPANDAGADDRDAIRLKAKQAAEAQIERRDRAQTDDAGDAKAPVARDIDVPVGCGAAAPTNSATNAPCAAIDCTGNGHPELQDNNGQLSDQAADDPPQSQPDAADQLAEGGLAAATGAVTASAQNAQYEATAAPVVAAPNAVSPDEAVAMAQAAVAAAATTLPMDAISADSASVDLEQQASAAAPSVANDKAKKVAMAVNDSAAPAELIAASTDQAMAVGKTTAQDAESAGVVFRQSTGGAKVKPHGSGPGTAGAQGQTHQADSPGPQKTVAGPQAVTNTTVDQGEHAAAAVAAIDGEYGANDQSGAAGWALHLAQGAAGKRADFIANLRQHLQNLPAHEQVAIHIQRAVSDRLGKLTVDLAPVELGRIQVRLKIDEENRVSASVLVERPATLELLQRDSKALERALQEAGLKTDSSSLSFTLKGGQTGDFGQETGFLASGAAVKPGENADNAADSTPLTRLSVVETADALVDVEV